MAIDASATVLILSASPIEDDHICLHRILESTDWGTYMEPRWLLKRTTTLEAALTELRQVRVGIVVCERNLPPRFLEGFTDRGIRVAGSAAGDCDAGTGE